MNDEERSDRVADLYQTVALQKRAPEGPKATGYCLQCEEPLPPDHRWCDADCRDDWEKSNGLG